MRRRRSETINAENFDEYLRLSQLPQIPSKTRQRNSLPEPFLLSQPFLQNSLNLPQIAPSTLNKKPRDSVKTSSVSSDYWDDIDFDSCEDNSETNPATSTGSIESVGQGSAENGETNTFPRKLNTTNVMIIGKRESGRHRLIGSIFEDYNENEDKRRTSFDLIMRKRETDEANELYKFWIKDAGCEKYQHLFKVYYQTTDLLVFVYQVNDKTSFNCLDKAIQQAKNISSAKEFNAVLIGTIPNGFSENQREVEFEIAEELRQKYELKMFMESELNYDKENQRTFEFLIPQKKKIEDEVFKC